MTMVLIQQMNPRHSPTLEKTGLGTLRRLEVAEVDVNLSVESRDINTVVGGPVVLDPHETLGKQINRSLRRPAIEA